MSAYEQEDPNDNRPFDQVICKDIIPQISPEVLQQWSVMSPEMMKKKERNAKAKACRQEKAAEKVAQKAASTSANVLRESDNLDSEHDDPKTARPRKKSRTEAPTPDSDASDISAYVLVTILLSLTLKVPARGKVANALPKVILHGPFFFGVNTAYNEFLQAIATAVGSMVMSIGERIKDRVIEVWMPPPTKSLDAVPVGWYTGTENQVPEVDYDEILNPPQTMSIREQMAGLDVVELGADLAARFYNVPERTGTLWNILVYSIIVQGIKLMWVSDIIGGAQ
ncbi:hypothetical protein GLOTRDRAFT_125021 [Gloeophyllum trabeum ATCC 11539]|uniref:Uncharacterized protein n=1 Tax=Gloeophyllum trabeum (strain ATCC 11539 / FP-39264 / Madison 617) TaxID=670483 RepID=S7S1H0_GLOTA|nr:uncharacterized protein GLOTRDRAFT_125021 [Gloeophyllum trabeum ATCC 11539]EPQ61300.1 hypothetical protein GLOTRDRAFT_125021 [Gloeophyllum trabeum ATCC 11539]